MAKKLLLVGLFSSIGFSFAAGINTQVSNNSVESTPVFTPAEIKKLKQIAEKDKLDIYSGVLGTAPKNRTISATGAAVEETQTGPQLYLFWTQTLNTGFYYEGRIYGKYNMRTQNPAFPDVPPSAEDNPNGYKGVVKLGYNFHINSDYDITPYIRLEAGNDMSLVYEDKNGNYIHSTNYAYLAGFKQTFKLTEKFVPYIDIYGGISQVSLNGNFTEGVNPNQQITGSVEQDQMTTEFGAAYKITEHQSIIPYMQFIYTSNNPNDTASAGIGKGGFGVSSLTTTQQVFALKYSYAW